MTRRILDKRVVHGPTGWYAEVYTDDDQASGYGDNPLVGHWYGTFHECAALDPTEVDLYPLSGREGVDAFDLACERRWD